MGCSGVRRVGGGAKHHSVIVLTPYPNQTPKVKGFGGRAESHLRRTYSWSLRAPPGIRRTTRWSDSLVRGRFRISVRRLKHGRLVRRQPRPLSMPRILSSLEMDDCLAHNSNSPAQSEASQPTLPYRALSPRASAQRHRVQDSALQDRPSQTQLTSRRILRPVYLQSVREPQKS